MKKSGYKKINKLPLAINIDEIMTAKNFHIKNNVQGEYLLNNT